MSPYTAWAAAFWTFDTSPSLKSYLNEQCQTQSFDLSFFEGNIEISARLVILLNDFERDFRVWLLRGSWRRDVSFGVQSRTTRPRSCTAFCKSSSSDETLRCFMWSSSESEDWDDHPGLAWTWNKFFLPFILLYLTLRLSLIILIGPIDASFFVSFDWLSRYYWLFWFVDFGVAWNANEFRTFLLQSAFTVSGLFLEIFE